MSDFQEATLSRRIVKLPIGKIALAANASHLLSLRMNVYDNEFLILSTAAKPHPILDEAQNQLFEYFQGKRENFDLPLGLSGTAFQLDVWAALVKIPFGQRTHYSTIARSLLKVGASRAVGSAIRANPLPIIIPCHRVVPKGGEVGNYSGGVNLKSFLLKFEAGQESLALRHQLRP